MHLIEIHYEELAELNMSQRCKSQFNIIATYSYLKGSDNITLRVKIKDVMKK